MKCRRIFQDDDNIRGAHLEIFVAEIFTQIRPVWAGDLETRAKNPKCLCLGPYITVLQYYHLFPRDFSFSTIGDIAKKYQLAIFKHKPSNF
jgi:hypothetical protein